ncbi:MAG: HTTM domain-containing protein [Verrucomicrobiota bacterium]
MGLSNNAEPLNTEDYQPFRSFALIWGITTLIHQLSFSFWLQTWPGWLLTYCAFLVVLEPRCFVRFSALIVTSLMNWFYKLPFVPNHMLFEGMINLMLLVGIIWVVWQHRKDLPSKKELMHEAWVRGWPFALGILVKFVHLNLTSEPRDHVIGGATTLIMVVAIGSALARKPVEIPKVRRQFIDTVAPVLRIQVVIIYIWAAIQKCNWDYWNPVHSCAALLHKEIALLLPMVPAAPWSQYCAIWGSLMFEFGIPILLLVPRLRALGFFAAIFFHLWLSVHPAGGIYSFSSLIFAALYLFLPKAATNELQSMWSRTLRSISKGQPDRARGIIRWSIVVIFVVAVVFQGYLYLTQGRTREVFETKANRVGFLLWLIWGVWLAQCYLVAVWRERASFRAWPNRPTLNPAWIMVIPVLFNGFNPWVGLKTQTSFSMYSNLRSEGNFGNHAFLKRWDLFPMQNDLVELIDYEPNILEPPEKPKNLMQHANSGSIFPYFELRRLLSEHDGDVRVIYRRNGEELGVIRKGDYVTGDEHLFKPIPWYQYKLLWFRRLESLEDPMHCTH